MKKLPKKGVLLFAAVMAVCAFTLPPMASASSWGVVGSHHTLDSPDFGFTQTTAIGSVTSHCSRSSFTVNAASTVNLEITTASFGDCTWSGPNIGDCTATTVGTKFPWTATAGTPNTIQIHGIHIDVFFEQVPGQNSCAQLVGAALTITGTLTGGRWTGNGAGQHAIDFSNAEGVVEHGGLGNGLPMTWRATLTDTQQTLVVN
jgi:hypothetical protein